MVSFIRIDDQLKSEYLISYAIIIRIDRFKTITGNEFYITNIDDTYIRLSIPNNATNLMTLNINNLRKMLESGEKFEKIKDITRFFGNAFQLQTYSYYFVLYKKIISNTKNDFG
ncbi:hypothetical protein [Thomasclavelia spiroformis]|uniref:hypothetical protein n=1 Tax=Thomasclavelia spiroformis TaxID=29348 RepID=UPI00241F6EA2|nr:hypothetical protein [Thomasclavelia spiroformis]